MRSGWTRRCVLPALTIAMAWLAAAGSSSAQTPLRKIGEMELKLVGLNAAIDPEHPVIPKNTRAGVAVVVQAGGVGLPAAEVSRLLGGAFSIEAQLTGPGLAAPKALALEVNASATGPLVLPLDPLPIAGDYTLSQMRIVKDGRALLDLSPAQATVQVIEQVLVTSVKTRALTLDEIRQKGIVLDRDDYLGFEFTLGMKLESKVVNVSLPVVFDRQGLAVPEYLRPPDVGVSGVAVPTFVPMMLEFDDPLIAPGGVVTLPSGDQVTLRIPSLLVIPGNVGYLKQMFSAQLFVANGAPAGSGLTVRDVTGTIRLPAGDDHTTGTADDPLSLATTVRGVQPAVMSVRAIGPDGTPETGEGRFQPGEQGQAEFLLVGEREGFHPIAFDILAVLDGLPTGATTLTGHASGAVLVRNPFFNVSFTVPAVARRGEPFTLYATVTNIGQGMANDVRVSLDSSRMSGVTLIGDEVQTIPTLQAGDARTLAFRFQSDRTGQVVASYLRFDGAAAGGDVRFTLGVGERGVPLSPDTLVLPVVVDNLPPSLVDAAMRVLGQAWSVAQSPAGTLAAGVARITPTTVLQRAQLLAEAGLRVSLGQAAADAVRDLAFDFYGGTPFDAGFDQLLRTTSAGRDFAAALGAALGGGASADALHLALSQVASSGPDFIAVAVSAPASSLDVALVDAGGRRTAAGAVSGTPAADVRTAVFLPLAPDGASVLGLVAAPTAGPYTLDLAGRGATSVDLAVTLPRGDGTFVRGALDGLALTASGRARLVLDPLGAGALSVQVDADGDGTFETAQPLALSGIAAQGPHLLSATVVGPETLATASPFGLTAALLFDRVVDRTGAGDPTRYAVASNRVFSADRQLSGRLVFLTLEQPEGPYVAAALTAQALADVRGNAGSAATVPLHSRLADPGGIVTGRVLEADGRPVVGASVIYSNMTCGATQPMALAAATTAADGGFEFRYVRQDPCGAPFTLSTQD